MKFKDTLSHYTKPVGNWLGSLSLSPSSSNRMMIKGLAGMGLLAGGTAGFGFLLGGFSGLYLSLGLTSALHLTTLWFSREIAFFFQGVEEVKSGEMVEGFDLNKIIEDLIKDKHVDLKTMPKVGIVESDVLNAFATGRHKGHTGIAVNRGLLKQARKYADRSEGKFTAEALVSAILLHELGHLSNRDILINTTALVLASTLAGLSNQFYENYFKSLNEKSRVSHRRGVLVDEDSTKKATEQDKSSNAWLTPLVFVAGWTIPLMTRLITKLISRTRETAADEMAFHCGQGEALQYALLMLKDKVYTKTPIDNQELKARLATFKKFDGGIYCHAHSDEPLASNHEKPKGWFARSFDSTVQMFSTHPRIEDRVKHLQELQAEQASSQPSPAK